MLKILQKLSSQKGATLVEYAVIVALIIVVALTSITTLGTKVNTKINNVATTIN